MNTVVEEQRYQAFLDYERHHASGETHSPFLTDRETAELTAMTTLGPLALVAFDTQPQPGIRPIPEAQPEPEALGVPDTIGDTDGFDRIELLTLMRQQHGLARAAIMFADTKVN
jgi:hypothetical protein